MHKIVGYIVAKIDIRTQETIEYGPAYKRFDDCDKVVRHLNRTNKDPNSLYIVDEVPDDSDIAKELMEEE